MAKTKKAPTGKPSTSQIIKDLESKYIRALADYQNLEKRTKQQQAGFIQLANSSLISKLLPIIDNLEIAALHLKDSGLDLILTQLHSILETEGVTQINPIDANFDTAQMECVEMVPGQPGKVIKVVSKGYRLNHQLIRPAKVQVGQESSTKSEYSHK